MRGSSWSVSNDHAVLMNHEWTGLATHLPTLVMFIPTFHVLLVSLLIHVSIALISPAARLFYARISPPLLFQDFIPGGLLSWSNCIFSSCSPLPNECHDVSQWGRWLFARLESGRESTEGKSYRPFDCLLDQDKHGPRHTNPDPKRAYIYRHVVCLPDSPPSSWLMPDCLLKDSSLQHTVIMICRQCEICFPESWSFPTRRIRAYPDLYTRFDSPVT